MSEVQTRAPIAKAARLRSPRFPSPAVLIVAVLFVTMIGLSIWYLDAPGTTGGPGRSAIRTFDMAARVDGRIGQIVVARAQNVRAGRTADPHRQPRAAGEAAAERGGPGRGGSRAGARQGGVSRRRSSPSARRRSTAPRRTLRLAQRRSTARGRAGRAHTIRRNRSSTATARH